MKKRFLWLATVFLALSITIAGSVVALAKSQRQPENPLAGQVLQKGDLPQDSEGYYAGQLMDDRFPGPLCPVNIPVQVEGFLGGYEMNAWYPITLRDGNLQGKQGGDFVLNVVYQYQDKVQAAEALERQLEWFHKQDIAMEAEVHQLDYDESLATANGMRGSAMQLTYTQENQTWVTYWFFGIKGDTLRLLMIDGLPDPATREVFNALTAKVIQR